MRLFLTILLSSLVLNVFGQMSNLQGDVLDEKGQPLPSATIVLLNPSDSTMAYFGISAENGHWEIKNVRSGSYLMQFAFLGYETTYRDIVFPYDKGEYWGIMAMKPKAVNLDGVNVIGEYVPLRINKDTLEFNARAFSTKPDAVVEDLLKKLPGIQVDRAGNVKALGEDVRKVLVDGKEFFGNDPKVATKNLPAEAIEKVQVFDRKSEEAIFTGVDDGSRQKAMNLVLKEDQKKGVFGHLMGGYGTDNHYQANAKLYKFTDKIQAAALGMQNNINQFGFSFQDYMDFKGGIASLMSGGSANIKIEADGSAPINFGQPVSGLSTSGAGGANFSYSWNKKRRVFLSYMANGTSKDLERNTTTRNYLESNSYTQTEDLVQTNKDTTHSINFGLRYEIDSTQNIIIDGGGSLTFSNRWGQTYTNSFADDIMMNRLDRNNNQGSNRSNLNAKISWLKKLNNNKTIAKLSANTSYSSSLSNLDWNNKSWFAGDEEESTESLFQKTKTENLRYGGSTSVTQKLGKKFFIIPEVRLASSSETLNRTQGIPYPSDAIIDSLSPSFNRIYDYVKPGLTLKRSTKHTQLNVFLKGEMYRTSNSLWNDQAVSESALYLLPGMNIDWEYHTGHRINLMYQSELAQPSLNQLLPVQDNNNSLSVFHGNRNLKPEFRNNLFMHWIIFDQFSFTSLFTSLNATYTKDKINWSRTINDQFEQTATLINVDDDYNANARMDFSTPIRKLGVKFNAGISETWNRGMNIVNGIENTTTNLSHHISMSIENRTKKKWDIIAGGSISLTDAKYSLQESLNNRYTDFAYYTELRFNPNDHWNFFVSADVTNYNDKSFGSSISIPLIGAEVSYFFLKNKRASISIQGADLLNKNKGIQRVSEMNYLRETRSNIIGRYVMLSFKYRLNKFGGGDGIVIKTHR
ncbi:MAG: outer membrane beta-barrel protein [Bacteroidales bacterium]|nr:outer membrane beta-barrel protein [Bacteroidales bacterium]